jgi:hypothetical protein
MPLTLYRTYFPHENFKTGSDLSKAVDATLAPSSPAEGKAKENEAEGAPMQETKGVHRATTDTIATSSDVQSPVVKEPSSKKIKLSTSAAEDLSESKKDDDGVKVSEPTSAVSATSGEWVEVDKSSIPHKATVEDAEDE